MLEQIVGRLGGGGHPMESIAHAIGMSPSGGATRRKIGAMTAFGLLTKTPTGYAVTKLAKSILRPLPGELPQLLQESIQEVPLYRDLLDTYRPDGKVPLALPIVLERKFGISSGNGEYAAKVFIESARFAALIDEEGNFVGNEGAPVVEAPEPRAPEARATLTLSDLANQPVKEELTIVLGNPPSRLSILSGLSTPEVKRIINWIDFAVKPWLQFQATDTELDGEANA